VLVSNLVGVIDKPAWDVLVGVEGGGGGGGGGEVKRKGGGYMT